MKSAESTEENPEYLLASQFVNDTHRSVFLTGKAGTGKTTFLRKLLKETGKKTVVVAPTGVAAINAGGSTIHSLFGLPTRAFLPTTAPCDPNVANNIGMLREHFHYPKAKRDIFQALELLVIDEISMVRADILDAIDHSLRFSRNSSQPFGGVQLLMIGDLYQLPPVVTEYERPLLYEHYSSEFFFAAKVYQHIQPITIELTKVYRQQDKNFITLLNLIRNNSMESWDYENLAEKVQPEFRPEESGWITLTTHNKQAEAINERELQRLEDPEQNFVANVSGEFNESSFPTDGILRLKTGAQVMFVKNDSSWERRYFNGKIGTVIKIEKTKLHIDCNDGQPPLEIGKETWKNLRYSFNGETQSVDQEEIGEFQQFPVRLAWAITIHKSQGLTFEKAMIDAGKSFAPGQVYVALSRCVSLDGMVLVTPIRSQNIISDFRIIQFFDAQPKARDLEEILEEERKKFHRNELSQVYGLGHVLRNFNGLVVAISKEKNQTVAGKVSELAYLREILINLNETAQKFQLSLQQKFQQHDAEEKQIRAELSSSEAASKLIIQQTELTHWLMDRCSKAGNYFVGRIEKDVVKVVSDTMNLKSKNGKSVGTQKIKDRVVEFQALCLHYCEKLRRVKYEETLLFIPEE